MYYELIFWLGLGIIKYWWAEILDENGRNLDPLAGTRMAENTDACASATRAQGRGDFEHTHSPIYRKDARTHSSYLIIEKEGEKSNSATEHDKTSSASLVSPSHFDPLHWGKCIIKI